MITNLFHTVFALAIFGSILVALGETALRYRIAINSIKRHELERFINDFDFPISFIYKLARKIDSDKNRDYLDIVYEKKKPSSFLAFGLFTGLGHLSYTVMSIHAVLSDVDPLTRLSTLLYLVFAIPGFIVAVRFGHGIVQYMDTSSENLNDNISSDEF